MVYDSVELQHLAKHVLVSFNFGTDCIHSAAELFLFAGGILRFHCLLYLAYLDQIDTVSGMALGTLLDWDSKNIVVHMA